jgi:hypothetical protein
MSEESNKEGIGLLSSPVTHLVVLHRVLNGTIKPEEAQEYLHQHLCPDADLADLGRPLKYQYWDNTSFIYFAAHAPEIPPWFERKEWKEKVAVRVSKYPDTMEMRIITKTETCMEHLVRWRTEYAKAMIEQLSEKKS